MDSKDCPDCGDEMIAVIAQPFGPGFYTMWWVCDCGQKVAVDVHSLVEFRLWADQIAAGHSGAPL